jgi:hypothetical protein
MPGSGGWGKAFLTLLGRTPGAPAVSPLVNAIALLVRWLSRRAALVASSCRKRLAPPLSPPNLQRAATRRRTAAAEVLSSIVDPPFAGVRSPFARGAKR